MKTFLRYNEMGNGHVVADEHLIDKTLPLTLREVRTQVPTATLILIPTLILTLTLILILTSYKV